MKRYRLYRGTLREHADGEWVRYADAERLQDALHEVAEMIEHEADRTLIYNHCQQAAEAEGE